MSSRTSFPPPSPLSWRLPQVQSMRLEVDDRSFGSPINSQRSPSVPAAAAREVKAEVVAAAARSFSESHSSFASLGSPVSRESAATTVLQRSFTSPLGEELRLQRSLTDPLAGEASPMPLAPLKEESTPQSGATQAFSVPFEQCATPEMVSEYRFLATVYKENPRIARFYKRQVSQLRPEQIRLDNERDALARQLNKLDTSKRALLEPQRVELAEQYEKLSDRIVQLGIEIDYACRVAWKKYPAIQRRLPRISPRSDRRENSVASLSPISVTTVQVVKE